MSVNKSITNLIPVILGIYNAKNVLVAVMIASLVLSSSLTIIPAEAKQEGKRVLAFTDEEAKKAVAQGCKVVQETRGLKALVCNPVVADALGLQEDIQMFAVDAGANQQIGATTVQTSGNTGAGRVIAILDTGYNKDHPELVSSYAGGYDFVNNDPDPMDDNGHGSHVAGLITADGVSSSAKGVAPDVGIIAVKVLDASGSGYFSSIISGMNWVIDNYPNVDAISMSLGSSKTFKGTCDNYMPTMTNAITAAKNKGITVVIAAGNSGNAGVAFPGCISSALTVGAVDKNDNIASFSGRGSAVDVTAPGVSLNSSWLGSSYYTASGTSMATPVVSGTVALIKSAHNDWTPNQVINSITSTAKDLGAKGFDTSYGYGRIVASLAVK